MLSPVSSASCRRQIYVRLCSFSFGYISTTMRCGELIYILQGCSLRQTVGKIAWLESTTKIFYFLWSTTAVENPASVCVVLCDYVVCCILRGMMWYPSFRMMIDITVSPGKPLGWVLIQSEDYPDSGFIKYISNWLRLTVLNLPGRKLWEWSSWGSTGNQVAWIIN